MNQDLSGPVAGSGLPCGDVPGRVQLAQRGPHHGRPVRRGIHQVADTERVRKWAAGEQERQDAQGGEPAGRIERGCRVNLDFAVY